MLAWLNGSADRAPVLLDLRSNKYFICFTVAAAVFTDIFLYGIIVPVLPFALNSRAGIAIDKTQTWVSILLAVYGAALLVSSPFFGWFADRSTSRRMPLLLGLIALAASTVALTVGESIAALVVGRILQGISAAVVWVVGLALLVDTVGPQDIGMFMGYVGLAMSLAVLAAPLLGGIVFDKAGYYAVFAMAYGLLGMDIILRLALIEKKIAARWRPEEEVVQTEDSQDMGREKTGPVESSPGPGKTEEEWTPTQEQQHQRAEGRKPKSLPPVITLLSSRRLLAALWGCLIQASLLTSFDSTLPLFVRDNFGWNSLGAGLIFLPIVLPSFIGPVVGWFSDKYGPRWPAFAGFVLATPLLILLRLVTHDSMRQKVLLCALLALIGVTLTIVLTPLMAEIAYTVEAKAAKRPPGFYGKSGAYAQAYGLFNMAFAGGCLVGPLVAGLIQNAAGWGTMTIVLGCLAAFSAIPTLIWSGGSIFKSRKAKKEEMQNAQAATEEVIAE
ncbi:hypothetical protein H2203_000481 [Taxawa tesnikishii (nom. ined.)]|nr:hypothetical protein H2203_000481 [Dothideales sp. JES 119]